MYSDLRVAEMVVGSEFEGYYVLKAAAGKTSNNGRPYLTATLSDRTGDIDAKVWDYSGPVGQKDEGKVVKVRGSVSEYRGSHLVPTAPIDAKAAYEELMEYVASIEDGDYRRVCEEIYSTHGDKLRTIPAGKSVHHSFLNGLLMHTLNMARQADFLAELYAETVDRSLLLAGTCLHDMGKEWEFEFSELGLVTEYSVKGQLLGHLVMGAGEVAEVCRRLGVPEKKEVLLTHMLLSHHGDPELGAAVRPMCAEAELLSLIDMIDSRMEIYEENLRNVAPDSFSGRIFALEKRIYRHI